MSHPSPTDEQAGYARLGPRSLLWRYAGDWRAMLPGSSAGILQLMHPGIGAGVAEHSAFFEDPMARIRRSVPQIWASIFQPDGEARGRAIRDLHRHVKGVDGAGRRYHALDAETFWWAHATFTWEIFRSVELFHRRSLRREEAEQLYADTVAWYDRYGMSHRPVPPTYDAFRERFDAVCRHTLERTPAVDRALTVKVADLGDDALGPPALRSLLAPVVAPTAELLVAGCMPGVVRRQLGMQWGPAERAQFRGLTAAIRQGFRFVPHPLNQRTFWHVQRMVGARTRPERYRPAAA
jgi:uncharacterized protein (DUF2236 family)